jgi:hypothetical protein
MDRFDELSVGRMLPIPLRLVDGRSLDANVFVVRCKGGGGGGAGGTGMLELDIMFQMLQVLPQQQHVEYQLMIDCALVVEEYIVVKVKDDYSLSSLFYSSKLFERSFLKHSNLGN